MEVRMRRCTECKNGYLERSVLPEHTEDLGGVVVTVRNAVQAYRCPECGEEETAIPDMQGLVRAVAIARALDPARLAGRELRFMRRALDMTQQAFAEAMELAPETVSRWENDVPGIGGMSEKLVRHNICALLYKHTIGLHYDPQVIADMRFTTPGSAVSPIIMERVRVKQNCEHEDAWDMAA
jgi:putative zinc finger/helix-turn-helix YgiT family protein